MRAHIYREATAGKNDDCRAVSPQGIARNNGSDFAYIRSVCVCVCHVQPTLARETNLNVNISSVLLTALMGHRRRCGSCVVA